jgi:SAM-dependent methyltransferase
MTAESDSDGAVRVDVGCGAKKRGGFIGLDHVAGPGIDHVLDLTADPYPFPDRSVDEVFSSHFLEHIDVPNHIFEEIGRICKDGARIEFWTPYAFTSEAFLYGHVHCITEETWLHLCVSHRDLFAPMLKGRWQLQTLVYVIEETTIADLARHGVDLDFAVRHLNGVVKEFGVEIDFRSDLARPVSIPTRVYATSRFGERHPLAPGNDGSNLRGRFRREFRAGSHRLRKLAAFVVSPLRSHGGARVTGEERP